ncbi:MAG: hypothetical protein WCN95_01550, partial [bacterium]
MKNSFHRIVIAVSLLPLLAPMPVAAREDLVSNLRLITSVPENDYSSTLTPDGKWVVFVSERTGDKQLFTAPLTPGSVSATRVLAPNPGDDHSPQISPDGRWLAWISTREDAFGDVWVMQYPDGNPIRVSKRGQRDSNPRWHPAGSRPILIYDAQEPDGARKVMAAEAGNWTPHEYAAPDTATNLPPPFNACVISAPASQGEPWVLVTDDTNGDGIFNENDHRTAWTTTGNGVTWRQITPPLAGLNSPRISGKTFVLSLSLRDDLDIAVVETPFEIARLTNSVDAIRVASRMWDDFPFDPYTPVSYLRQAYLLDPGSENGLSAIFQAADILESANRPEQALSMLGFVEAQSKPTQATAVEFAYRRVVLELAKSGRDRLSPAEIKVRTDDAVKRLTAFAGSSPDLPPSLRARILLQQARIGLTHEDSTGALAAAKQIAQINGTPRRLLGQAALLRGEIYTGLGIPDQTVLAYRAIVADFGDQADLSEEAAVRLASIAISAELDTEKQIQTLKQLRTDTLAGVRSAAALLEGRLSAVSGDTKGARDTWTGMISAADTNPRLAARAAFELGGLLAQLGEYQKAIEVFDSITIKLRDQLFGGAPALYRQARQKRINEYLAKGNYEFLAGDARMALATFSELAQLEPALVEAWRGVLEAQSRCGLLDSRQIAAYQTKAGKAPGSALDQYIYGLALTYAKPMPENTIPQLERAITLNGSVPYFHQTLGFVHEHLGRLQNRPERRAAALNEYERALILLNAAGEVRTVDYARLLINSGNAALAVSSYHRAADLFERRLELGIPFDSPANEFLMARSAGIAFSRASRPNDAVTSFGKAVKLIPSIITAGLLNPEQAREIGTELQDRTALALLNAGRYAESASAFAVVAQTAAPRSPSRVRAWRSSGFALHRLALGQSGMDRDKSLNAAAVALNEALLVLDAGTVPEAKSKSGGMFQLDVSVSSDNETGGAMLGFSAAQERRLILSALSRVFEDLGLPAQAVVRLREQIASPVPARDETVAYYTTARLVALDRLAYNLQNCGNREESAKTLLEAIQTARYEVRGEINYNANALSLSLPRLTELALAGNNPPFTTSQLAGTWLFAAEKSVKQVIAPVDTLTCLETALRSSLELRNSKTAEYILQWGVQRSRVMLARALVLERMSNGAAARTKDPLSAIRAAGLSAGAVQLARQTIDMAATSRDGGEIKRIALMGHALLIRQAILLGKPGDAATLMNNGLAAADRYGFPALRWWLRAQGTLVSTTPAEDANAVLKELENLLPGTADDDADPSAELLHHCEQLSVGDQISAGAWDKAWSIAERWRAARLKLIFRAYVPQPEAGNDGNRSFMESAIALRSELQDAIQRVRARPLSEFATADGDAIEKARIRMSTHLANGRAQKFPGALLLNPQATPFEDACVLLDTDQRFPGGTALVLSSGGHTVAWTKDGLTKLETNAAWSDLENRVHLLFVLGDRLTKKLLKSTTVVNMLTFETTYTRIEDPRLDIGTGIAKWPAANAVVLHFPEDLRNSLVGADKLRLTVPLTATRPSPTRWQLDTTDIHAGNVFSRLPPLNEVSAVIQSPKSATDTERATMEESLAALMAATGAATLNVNGQIWIAPVIPISVMPDLAEAWIARDSGLVKTCLERSDMAGAVAPLRRLLRLRVALNKPAGEIAEAASLLASVEGKLERWDQAVEAAGKAVDVRLSGGDSEALAKELSRYGSFLNDDRKFDLAYKAYTDAAAMYQRLGNTKKHADMFARSGVALENGGRFQEALTIYDLAASMAADSADKVAEARQLRRKGKIYLQRQNRYLEADQAFSRAAALSAEANAPGDALLAQLDVARVQERIGAYAEAIAISSRIADAAVAQKDLLLQADALLTRALVEWASADYFHAFKSQR